MNSLISQGKVDKRTGKGRRPTEGHLSISVASRLSITLKELQEMELCRTNMICDDLLSVICLRLDDVFHMRTTEARALISVRDFDWFEVNYIDSNFK